MSPLSPVFRYTTVSVSGLTPPMCGCVQFLTILGDLQSFSVPSEEGTSEVFLILEVCVELKFEDRSS